MRVRMMRVGMCGVGCGCGSCCCCRVVVGPKWDGSRLVSVDAFHFDVLGRQGAWSPPHAGQPDAEFSRQYGDPFTEALTNVIAQPVAIRSRRVEARRQHHISRRTTETIKVCVKKVPLVAFLVRAGGTSAPIPGLVLKYEPVHHQKGCFPGGRRAALTSTTSSTLHPCRGPRLAARPCCSFFLHSGAHRRRGGRNNASHGDVLGDRSASSSRYGGKRNWGNGRRRWMEGGDKNKSRRDARIDARGCWGALLVEVVRGWGRAHGGSKEK